MIEKLKKQDFDKLFSLMEMSFPSDEYRVRAGQEKLFDNPLYSVYALRESEGALTAFISAWDFDDFSYIEHFAVNPNFRNGGIGSRMLKEVVEMLGKRTCLEVELPENDMAKRRIGFYERNGFFLNDYPYIQPAMSEGKHEIPLLVMTTGGAIGKTEFEKMRAVLYKEVYNVK